ncbi:MAG: FHA domain-containing protein [Verrucomicrobiia bacterium]|jgi:pSer/pThr/pTyr-binding forkhead associated (FHA) protein
MSALVHHRSDGSTRTLEFTVATDGAAKPLIIGRLSTSDIMVRDTFVSRVHCDVTFINGQVILKDLGSANGTYRNGARIYDAPLNPGDKIQIGNTTLVFELEAGTGNAILRQMSHMVVPPASDSNVNPPSSPKTAGNVEEPPSTSQLASNIKPPSAPHGG